MSAAKHVSPRTILKSLILGAAVLTAVTLSVPFNLAPTAEAAGLTADSEPAPLWQASGIKNKVVVVSDLHFGIDDSFAENVQNRSRFVEFLQRLEKTRDVRELVIAGDFLDEWFLPLNYGPVTDERAFFLEVARKNPSVIEELKKVMAADIKLVYVIGNHDMNLENGLLSSLLPGLVEPHDAKGLGRYITGDRQEIVIEHGHRYDPYSAPDRVSNRELLQSESTMYPPGYFYARMGASWVAENRPKIKKNYPVLGKAPDAADTDQMGAYVYAKTLEGLFNRITEKSGFEDKVFRLATCGFNSSYSLKDMYPVAQADGRISAPVLFRDFQRSWDERQEMNEVGVKVPFLKAGASAGSHRYFYDCAREEYLNRPHTSYDVVVFGHTHVPDFKQEGRKIYANSGTWIDHNFDYPEATRTFVVIETGAVDRVTLQAYQKDGSLADLTAKVN